MTSPKPRRRWFQFSLRTFFILMTAFCIWFGWKMNEAREQKKAVEWVQEMGGWVRYAYEIDDAGEYMALGQPSGSNWFQRHLGVEQVVYISLANSQANDLTSLVALDDLRYLNLNNSPVSDLTPLGGLKELRGLFLIGTSIKDITPLARLPHLELLRLNDTQIDQKQIDKLQEALPNCDIRQTK